MSEKPEENTADPGAGASSWPTNLLKNANNNGTDPIQATHPVVVAVCNVLMFDGPLDYKAWHCPAEHVRTRETMEQCISHLILQRRPSATPEWIEKLPEVSKRIEKNLYFSARSIDDYSDPYTLVNRIQELVKVLITSAATLPVPAPGTAAAEAFSSANKTLQGGDEEGSQVDGVERSEKAGDAASGGPSTTEGATPSTGLSQLVGATKVDLSTVPLYLVPLKEAELAQQQAAAALRVGVGLPPQPVVIVQNNQVSSQGCSRVFIIKVLISVSEFVKGKSLPSIFTFKRELVMDWLIAAKQACCLPTYLAEEGYYGGPPFVSPDPSTHWSEPHQLYTWWKNNVERRSKFKVLQEDAKFKGLDPRRLQRARWCEAVVALSELIRASSGSSNVSRNGIQATSSSNGSSMGSLHSSVLSQMAHVPNPLTNSAAYIQALTASLNQHNQNYEDSNSESSGVTNSNAHYYSHSMTLPSFAQIHLATTTDDDRSGIDALMSMSSFASGYTGSDPITTTSVGTAGMAVPIATAGAEFDQLATIKSEPISHLSSYSASATAHLSPSHPQSLSGVVRDFPLASTLVSPGMPLPMSVHSHLANPLLTPSGGSGLAKPAPQLPLLSSFIPPSNNLIIGTHIIPGTNIPYRNYSNTFPVKLFDLVSSEDEGIVGWQGHGTSFQVRDMDKFVNLILPKHFKHNNFTSFQRQLNLYGFRRSASYDKGAYYHPQFQQGQRELAESIRRVLAPGSEGSGGKDGNGTSTSGSGTSGGSNSASALAMSYLNSLPPGATVHLPGVTPATSSGSTKNASMTNSSGNHYKGGYSIQELTGGDAAAESLLSMGAPITSMALPKTTSSGNGGSSGPGSDGTFSVMSHLHQQHQLEGKHGEKRAKLSAKDRKLLDMQQLGYNAEQFLASTTLSDRYTLGGNSTSLLAVPQHHHHHHSHGHSHVVGTSAATSISRGRGRPANKKKRGHSSEEEEEEDYEATYQDTIDNPKGNKGSRTAGTTSSGNKRKTQPSRRDSNSDDDNSVSSASIVNKQTTKRHSGSGAGTSSRNVSYRNLSTIGDVLGKSGLSRNSEITHLTQDAEEDLIDLRNPHGRRVYLDFTVLGHTPTDTTTNNNNVNSNSSGDECLDYVSGVYKGKLSLGRKDLSLHYQLHGSRVLPEALLRLANQRSSDNLNDTSSTSSPQSVSSFIAAQHKDNLPKETRVGKDYQCDLPVFSPVTPSAAATTGHNSNNSSSGLSTRRVTAYSATGSVPVWVPNTLSTECVDSFVALLKERKQRVPLPVGSVLVVHLPEEKAYRLCCVLEVVVSTAGDNTNTTNTANTTTMVRVFDGYEDWTVPISQCCFFREGEVELALQLLVKHHGQITSALVQEVDGLLQTGICSEGRISSLALTRIKSGTTSSWSAEEVQTFCSAVKRYGDNIQKVWSLRFASAGQKSLHELQEFFLTIYPHTQLGGAKRVVSVYARGQLAAAGRPNGEEESEENEEESGSESGEGEEERGVDDNSDTESRSSSGSKSGSDSGSGIDCKSGIEKDTQDTVKGDIVSVPLSSTASGASVVSAPIALAASPVLTTTTTAAVSAADVKSEEVAHTAGRKKRSVEVKEGQPISESTMVDAEVAIADVGATKRRRR